MPKETIKQNTQCRMCKGENLLQFLDLGTHPLANAFLSKEDLLKSEPRYPLRVFFCTDCNLVQLVDVVSPEVMFRDYVYFSSAMPTLSKHFEDYVEEVYDRFIDSSDNFAVEIGSNDGILLRAMKAKGVRVLGIDPAENIARVANERGIETLSEFFSEALAKRIVANRGNADVVIGNNVVAHIDDHHDLVKGVKSLLGERGVFIFEAPYLLDMLENLSFDTIYHEHLSYLALAPLTKLFGKFGMEIIDAKLFPVQGNSIRVYAARKGAYTVNSRIAELLKKEKEMRCDKIETYHALAERITELKKEVVGVCRQLKKEEKTIAGYGAPAKGNTLLNYFGIGAETLSSVTERLPSKIGLFTPGMHIPVRDLQEARANPPDYYFMLAWNYKDSILKDEKDFLSHGGKFIIPIGKERII
ncbi:MAG: class I SAM-dependent methyltransferase [Candidatus Niyogibacteria bacterium]|nr:class I SAM-dependent methyltransferase [Candidatus Niyogibacteria bacterium]